MSPGGMQNFQSLPVFTSPVVQQSETITNTLKYLLSLLEFDNLSVFGPFLFIKYFKMRWNYLLKP